MTAKLAWAGLSFLMGLALFCLDMGESFSAFVTAIAAVCLLAVFNKKYRVYVLTVGAFAAAGLLYGRAYTCFNYEKAVAFDGERVTVEGCITDFSYIGSDTCLVKVKGRINGGVKTEISFFTGDADFEYYQRVKISGEVRRIENDTDFPSADYNLAKGIFLEGAGSAETELAGGCANYFMRAVKSYRDYTAICISKAVSRSSGGFLKALVCGDKSEVERSVKTALYRSGIGHMFAMSGTHLTVIAAFVSMAVPVRSKRLRSAVICPVLIMFMGFAGFSPSVVRSGIMLMFAYCSSLFGRRSCCINLLGLCGLIMGIEDPYVIRDSAFILSFSAAFAIGVICPYMDKLTEHSMLRPLIQPMISSLVILFAVMPFSAALFDSVSVISPISNLILVPVCTAALILVLAGMLLGGGWILPQTLFRLAGDLAELVMKISRRLAGLSFAAVPGGYFKTAVFFALTAWFGIYLSVKYGRAGYFITASAISFVGMYSSVSLMRYLRREEIHIILIPDGKSCTAVVYKDNGGAVLDIGSRGGKDYAIQKIVSRRGIDRISCVFVSRGVRFTRTSLDPQLFPQPEEYAADLGETIFPEGSSAYLGDVEIARSSEGYTVSARGAEFEIGGGYVLSTEGALDISEEADPIEIIIYDNDYIVRRLDYAFNEQQ